MNCRIVKMMALLIVILLIPCSVLAAGKLVTTQENFYVTNGYSIYGRVFARIENKGDKPVEYSAGLFEIYDKNADTLASDSYLSVYGRYLAPGEYGYVVASESIKDVDVYTDVDDYMLTVTGKSNSGKYIKRINCKAEYTPNVQISRYSTRNFMTATFTNDTDDTLFDLHVVMALLDDDGNILDIETTSFYNSIGINPGSTVTVRESVDDDIRDAYERAGSQPTHVDAFAYIEVEE